MPIDLTKLKSNKLTAEEALSNSKAAERAAYSHWLAEQFIDPNTREPITVGEGIKIGPFDSDVEAKNFLTRYLADAICLLVKDHGWGKTTTKSGKRAATLRSEVKKTGDDGKAEVWLVRIKE